jgi:hypothetical protein
LIPLDLQVAQKLNRENRMRDRGGFGSGNFAVIIWHCELMHYQNERRRLEASSYACHRRNSL